jgi:ABC-type branched-subunit amino acid transport system substrate-binding protein
VGGALSCSAPPPDQTIPIGLLLSYTGDSAAIAVNSERALRMAIEAANHNGGVGGRPLRVLARDTRSDVRKVTAKATELVDAGAVVFIGPDIVDLADELRFLLRDRVMILPSFRTSSNVGFGVRPATWFVMGAGTEQIACELVAQVKADHRQKTLVILNPFGYNATIAWSLSNHYAMPKYVLPSDESSTASTIGPITAMEDVDAYVLAADPPSGSALVYALAATGKLTDPTRWYLSPTLHNPAFLETIPKGALDGAHGVSQGTVAGSSDFRTSFADRWNDAPVDDSYPFFDAGAVVVLALQRAMTVEGAIPDRTGLGKHILAVTHAGGYPVRWNELDQGLERLRSGEEVEYVGLSGQLEFDSRGNTPSANTKWWAIGADGFVDVPGQSDCHDR